MDRPQMKRPSIAQDKPAYRIFDGKGKECRYRTMVNRIAKADVVLVGELHQSPIIHWLEFEMTKDLFRRTRGRLSLGAEMFETDDQMVLDEYLTGAIEHDHLVKEAKVWENHSSDYRPLVEFAREHRLPFIATNIPRRYASIVSRNGIAALKGLSAEAKRLFVPLPFAIDPSAPGYDEIAEMARMHGMEDQAERFLAAQAIKDATMAHVILRHRAADRLFLHINGDFHSQRFGGIYWYLKLAEPMLKVTVISTVEAERLVFTDDQKGLADYLVMVPSSMPATQ